MPSASCHFLKLPTELRHQIYECSIISSTAIQVAPPDDTPAALHEPALLLTCRQIREECLQIYYIRNCFRGCASDVKQWLQYLCDTRVSLIREIQITSCTIGSVSSPWLAASHLRKLYHRINRRQLREKTLLIEIRDGKHRVLTNDPFRDSEKILALDSLRQKIILWKRERNNGRAIVY